MMLCVLHLAGDWVDIFHETYRRVDSSQHIDLKPVSSRMGGIRLHGSVANILEETPSAMRA